MVEISVEIEAMVVKLALKCLQSSEHFPLQISLKRFSAKIGFPVELLIQFPLKIVYFLKTKWIFQKEKRKRK